MKLTALFAYEVLASGGYPTIEVRATLEDGSVGRASVPYGASAGSQEAVMLTDKDPARYGGKGVMTACENVNGRIQTALAGVDAFDQALIDQTLIDLDGTPNKSALGGNALLAVSLAVAKAAALSQNLELYQYVASAFQLSPQGMRVPAPMMVVIEGGKHADDTTDLQEYCMTAQDVTRLQRENIRIVLESYHALKSVLQEQGLSTNVGNEGAFAPNGISSNEAPFEYMLQAIDRAGYTAGTDIGFSIDAAASEFYRDGQYHLSLDKLQLSSTEMIEYYRPWLQKYPIITMEDMLDEMDWDAWPKLRQLCDEYGVPLLGDDLTVTSEVLLAKAIEHKAISAILIKLNQIGTLTETIRTTSLAHQHGLVVVPSHRGGGETTDTAMVDVAVAVGAQYLKVGPTRGERVVKYNRIMEIERQMLG